MLISIIIATYNAEAFIEKTLKSIKDQTEKDYELIVIDGNSQDNTVKIIKSYSSIISFFLSEPDKGIYDAWNKGILNAKGNWVCFLGAGDVLQEDALSKYMVFIDESNKEFDYISSRVAIVDSHDKILYTIGSAWKWSKFRKFMNVAHVGSLHSSKYFNKYGLFDTSYKITGDYELLMRAKESLIAGFIPIITCKMLYGGVSESVSAIKEFYRIKIEKGGYSNLHALSEYYFAILKFRINFLLRRIGVYYKHRI